MLRKHNPVSVLYMKVNYPKHSICQLLRETYRMTDDENVKLNMRIAISMAKSMDRKLKEYSPNWTDGFWEE